PPEINSISTVILLATIPLVYIAERLERGAMRMRTGLGVVAGIFLLMAAPLAGRVLRLRDANLPQLNIYCWSTYISPRLIHGFEQEYHCKVNYDLYDSNEALLAKLQGGNVDYDIVVPSDYMVQILIQQQLLAPLDKSRLPNVWANLDRRFLRLPFDPENDYSVPYAWGTTGLAYRSDLEKGLLDSWDVLLDGPYAGRNVLQAELREAIRMPLKQLGYSLNSTNQDEIRRARDYLLAQKPTGEGHN